jgi:hypothetical protein
MNNETENTLNKNAVHNTTEIADSGEKAENHRQKEKRSSAESDKGPYSMFLKRRNRKPRSTRPLMTLDACKILDQSAIKYNLIGPVTRRIWEITFFSRSAANKVLWNVFLSQKGYLVWIQLTNIRITGIIREILHGMHPVVLIYNKFIEYFKSSQHNITSTCV